MVDKEGITELEKQLVEESEDLERQGNLHYISKDSLGEITVGVAQKHEGCCQGHGGNTCCGHHFRIEKQENEN